MDENEKIKQLQEIAQKKHVAEIRYKKAAIVQNPPSRLVEVYSIRQGKQDTLVRAYQLGNDEGWRLFMVHKITFIKDQETAFVPRTSTKNVSKSSEPYESWTPEVRAYRDMVLEALADSHITQQESEALKGHCLRHAIPNDVVRSVHASIFLNCLTHLLSDGLIENEEKNHLNLIHNCLIQCGCAVVG